MTAALPAAIVAESQCLDAGTASQLVMLERPGSPLKAIIDPRHGATLVGLRWGNSELLYRGMNFCPAAGWTGQAPILWPATGRNYAADPAEGPGGLGWIWDGQRYPMPIHGFARNEAWRLVRRSSDSATLELRDNPNTRRFYPFGFRFRLTYRLSGNGITLDHGVTSAPMQPAMPFSIGNHVTFAVSATGGATVSTGNSARVVLDKAGRPTAALPYPPLANVPLTQFAPDTALPLSGYRPGKARARLDLGTRLQIDFAQSASLPAAIDPIRYNLWGNVEAGYFSVEPWLGRQNSLSDRSGVIWLGPKKTFRWSLRMTILTASS